MVGSTSKNLTVVQTWEGGEAVDIILLLTDPLGYITFETDVKIPKGMDNTVVTKVDLPKPMIPGQWKAKVVYANSLVAEASFLILPEIYTQRTFSKKILIDYRLGTYVASMEATERSVHYNLLTADDKFYKTVDELQTYISSTQSQLLDWLDSLVLNFWTPDAACSVDYKTDCDVITLCNSTSWSSFSPDPKSELKGIDPKTGKMRFL